MRAKLEFDLEDPEDRISHRRCVQSTDMALALWDIVALLRNRVKYGKANKQTAELQQLVHEIMGNYNLDLSELLH